MMPVLVYGYDGETAWVADRANVPFQYPADLFDQARGRVKRYKHRLITLSPPDPAKTESAIIDGIRQTIAIFTEKPPKGSPKNFGFKAYDAWIEYLTNPKSPKSWVKQFPAGRPFFCALLDLFDRTAAFGQAQAGADRHTYATFLEEASVALGNPQLEDAALYWHASSVAWSNLLEYTLPFSEHMPPDEFRLARELLTERRDRFYAEGQSARERIIEIDTQIDELKSRMETDFPLDEVSFKKLQTIMIKLVTDIRNVEMEGIESLQNALS